MSQTPKAPDAALVGTPTRAPSQVQRRIRFGHIHADVVDFSGCLDAVGELVKAGRGGFVVTPNVDHVCLAEENLDLRDAYRDASLSVADGMPLIWLSRLMQVPLPEKISGSDLVEPLMERAAAQGWRVSFLGGAPGVGEAAAEVLRRRYSGLRIAGALSPEMGFDKDPAKNAALLQRLREQKPDLVLVALGCPKQELWMHQNLVHYAPAVALGIGATLDFIAGRVRRAPQWMSKAGLEWLYRLAQEPTRMASRYLVRDRAFVGVAWRMLTAPKDARQIRLEP
jgi:N-acetylglucosaminyldiphosphoundecaprenol N-acetyl-beta-D-mannosaminyltransferase